MARTPRSKHIRDWPCLIVGAGAAGIGVGRTLQELGIPFVILERHEVGGSFRRWPREMRFLTPSFPSNSFGMLDLNSVAIGTSPAFKLECEHPTGRQYADYLKSVVEFFQLPVQTGVDVRSVSPRSRGGFELETSNGRMSAEMLIWAAGEFQYPKVSSIAGARHGIHNSRVKSWKRMVGDEFVVIGGYESGIDAAVHLANAGKRVTVLERNSVWSSHASDPSVTLSPFTWDRLMATPDGQIELIDDVEIDSIERQRDGYVVTARTGERWTARQRPILATGFAGSPTLIRDLFDWRDDGVPLLNDVDESTRTPGLFLVGPQVRHERLVFCFIYKFRQRFGVVANAIGQRLGCDPAPLEKYRFWGMYLDDLSCCGDECVC